MNSKKVLYTMQKNNDNSTTKKMVKYQNPPIELIKFFNNFQHAVAMTTRNIKSPETVLHREYYFW